MSQGPSTSASARSAAEICRNIGLGRRARKLLDDQLKPGVYLCRLIEHRLHADAIRFMAHALLSREAVWWACLCVRHIEGENLAPDQHRALGAAVRWVLDPSEANRHEAAEAGAVVGDKTPAGCAALAAAHAVGAPSPDPSTPTNPVLAARFAAGSVLRAVARSRPEAISTNFRLFLGLGLDVAYGHHRWE